MTFHKASGLVLGIPLSQSLLLTKAGDHPMTVELTLKRIDHSAKTANLSAVIVGEKLAVQALGLKTTTFTVMVNTQTPTELLPGVLLQIGSDGEVPHVFDHALRLAIRADKDTWEIVRGEVADRTMLRHARRLSPRRPAPRCNIHHVQSWGKA